MTERKDPLNVVQRLADMAELRKSQQVAVSIASLSAEERRLAVLERYLAEYQEAGAKDRQLAIGALRTRSDFIAALSQAVRTQSEQVRQLRLQFEQRLTLWREAKAKASAVERFADRRESQRKQETARAEQTALDDSGRWSRPRE